MKLLTVSPSPHVYSSLSVKRLMYDVVIALLPALGLSLYYFGLGALIVTLTSVVSCLLFEYLISRFILKKEPSLMDGSALITGLLLAFNVPSNLPIWIIMIGALAAIGIGKMSFGGLGNNPFNPALVGRVFLLISFPAQMTSWPKPEALSMAYTDATTGATPLAVVSEGVKNGTSYETLADKFSYLNSFIGFEGGSIGEISALALIIGGVYLLIRRTISWHIPVTILLTVAVFTGLLHLGNGDRFADPLFHLLTGGLMLGAFFMATDYVTSPMSVKGMLVFAVGIGVLTVIIREFGAYPEGVSFAILLMNAFVPLLNKYLKPKRFGEKKAS